MFDVLDLLIEHLLFLYYEINNRWKATDYFKAVNLKKKTVSNIPSEVDIWNMIRNYRKFMSIQQLEILQSIHNLQSDKSRVSIRIKQLNSIEYKIYRYSNNELSGNVPINKCLNDLFGIRIIIDGIFTQAEIHTHIKEKFPELKITNASKNGYIASHIYIMTANQFFPWELQIWKKIDENNNLISHKIYKQGYTAWEKEFYSN